jgi:FkbM family methyltransferase
MALRDALHRGRWLARRWGWDVVRFSGDLEDLQRRLLRERSTDLVVDIGANEGQYARRIRLLGYSGRILSVEPGQDASSRLQGHAQGDAAWEVVRCAVGADAGTATLHVAHNTQSSSLLPVLPRHLEAESWAARESDETVSVQTLDGLLADRDAESLWLKLDCQGSEAAAIAGGPEALARANVVQCEMSLVPLYDGEGTLETLTPLLTGAGFEPWWVQPCFQSPQTGAALQVETLFVRP